MSISDHPTTRTTAAIHRDILGEKNNVIIPRIYIQFTQGDYVAAVVLKEIVWGSGDYSQTAERDGWMYNSEKQWQDNLSLSRKQVNRSIAHINTIADADLIQKRVGKRISPTGEVLNETITFYRLDTDLYEGIFGNVHEGNSGNVPNGSSGNSREGNSLSNYTGTINTGTNTGIPTEPKTPESPANFSVPAKKPMPRNGLAQTLLATLHEDVLHTPPPTNYGKAMKEASELAKAGCTPEEIKSIAEWLLADPFWGPKGVTINRVLTRRDEWLAASTAKPKKQLPRNMVTNKERTDKSVWTRGWEGGRIGESE